MHYLFQKPSLMAVTSSPWHVNHVSEHLYYNWHSSLKTYKVGTKLYKVYSVILWEQRRRCIVGYSACFDFFEFFSWHRWQHLKGHISTFWIIDIGEKPYKACYDRIITKKPGRPVLAPIPKKKLVVSALDTRLSDFRQTTLLF